MKVIKLETDDEKRFALYFPRIEDCIMFVAMHNWRWNIKWKTPVDENIDVNEIEENLYMDREKCSIKRRDWLVNKLHSLGYRRSDKYYAMIDWRHFGYYMKYNVRGGVICL